MVKLQLLTPGVTGSRNPAGPRRGLSSARLRPKPARHALCSSAANRPDKKRFPDVFFSVRQEAKRFGHPGPGRSPKPGRRGAQRPQGLGDPEAPQGASGACPAPARARPPPVTVRVPDKRPRRRKGPRRRRHGPQTPSPRLAHATLADDEDLQGGQYVLVHPDPRPLRAQPPRSSSQTLTKKGCPCMRTAPPPPPPSFYSGWMAEALFPP